MILRNKDETFNEHHAFHTADFNNSLPIAYQILNYGIKIQLD